MSPRIKRPLKRPVPEAPERPEGPAVVEDDEEFELHPGEVFVSEGERGRFIAFGLAPRRS